MYLLVYIVYVIGELLPTFCNATMSAGCFGCLLIVVVLPWNEFSHSVFH